MGQEICWPVVRACLLVVLALSAAVVVCFRFLSCKHSSSSSVVCFSSGSSSVAWWCLHSLPVLPASCCCHLFWCPWVRLVIVSLMQAAAKLTLTSLDAGRVWLATFSAVLLFAVALGAALQILLFVLAGTSGLPWLWLVHLFLEQLKPHWLDSLLLQVLLLRSDVSSVGL